MRMLLIAGFAAAVFAVGASDPTRAQEPIAPRDDILVVHRAGAYRLQWRDNPDPDAGVIATMIVMNEDGGERGRYEIADVPAEVTSIELPDRNKGLADGRCYPVVFNVMTRTRAGAVETHRSALHTLCTGVGGTIRTLAGTRFLTGMLPPPATVANLRISRNEFNYWDLDWDPSPNTARYVAVIQVLDGEGAVLGQATFRSVPGVSIVRIDRVATEFVGLGCFTAVARVFAVGVDGSVTLPASVTTPVCIGLYDVSFPEAGTGRADGNGRLWFATAILGALGAALMRAGVAVRRRA